MSDPYPVVDYEAWTDDEENILDCYEYPECPLIQNGKHDCLLLYMEREGFENTSFAEICYRVQRLRKAWKDSSNQKVKEDET